MARCDVTENCIFFYDLMAEMPLSANIYKKIYCAENSQNCARYIVRQSLGKDGVPLDLFPHQKNRIDEILCS